MRNGAVHRPDFIEKVYHFVLAGGLKAWILAHYFELRSNQALMESAPIFKCTASALWWWLFSFNVKVSKRREFQVVDWPALCVCDLK